MKLNSTLVSLLIDKTDSIYSQIYTQIALDIQRKINLEIVIHLNSPMSNVRMGVYPQNETH